MNVTALLSLLQNPSAISILLKVPQLLSMVKEPPKSGTSTTEFWITVAINAYMMFAPNVPSEVAAIAVPILSGIYVLARSIVKGLHSLGKAQNVNVPDLTPDQQKALGLTSGA